MTSLSLAGTTVVVTRPEGQADSLCRAIEAEGGFALRLPVLAVAPVADDAELAQACRDLDSFDLAFFVSPNAVKFALDYLLARRRWPSTLPVATVGQGSQRALKDYGFARVIAPEHGFDSEAVLALEAFSAERLAGKRVVIFRGDGGRALLGDTLTERGAQVRFVTAYRRYCPAVDPSELRERLVRGALDVIVFSSSEGVSNFVRLVGKTDMPGLCEVPVLASHPRIVMAAREAGFMHVALCQPGDEGVLQALRRGKWS